MKTIPIQAWINLGLFTLFGIGVFAAFYMLAAKNIPPLQEINDYYAGVIDFVNPKANAEQKRLAEKYPSIFKNFYALKRGETQSIDGVDVIFRGLEKGGDRFKLQIAIPALDPDSFYDYEYRIKDARKGFPLDGRKAKLLSAGKKTLHLMLMEENG